MFVILDAAAAVSSVHLDRRSSSFAGSSGGPSHADSAQWGSHHPRQGEFSPTGTAAPSWLAYRSDDRTILVTDS